MSEFLHFKTFYTSKSNHLLRVVGVQPAQGWGIKHEKQIKEGTDGAVCGVWHGMQGGGVVGWVHPGAHGGIVGLDGQFPHGWEI